jgi:hypothetical protein
LVGAVGILSIIPGLTGPDRRFWPEHIIWFVWLGIVLLRSNPVRITQKAGSVLAAR